MPSERSRSPIAGRTLGDRVAAFDAVLARQAPAPLLEAIAAEIEGLVRAGVGSAALRPGDLAPDFTLPDARGGEVSLPRLLGEGPAALVFYRGQWCPYCDLALRAYQEVLPRIRALGASLVAISPQTPDESLSTLEKRALAFGVLSDAGNAVARSYGLVFPVPAGLRAVHQAVRVDLERSNGEASGELPVPGVFVVGRDGRIAFRDVRADYRERLEPAELLRQLEQAAGGR